jgi:hypothetical protein
MQEVKINHKTIMERMKEIDLLLAKLIKEWDKPYKMPLLDKKNIFNKI